MTMMSPQSRYERRRQAYRGRLEDHIEDHAHRAMAREEDARRFEEEQKKIEDRNPEYMLGGVMMALRLLFFVVFLTAVWVADVLFFGPVSDFVVSLAFNSELAGLIGKFAVPAAIIVLELRVGQLRQDARGESMEGEPSGAYAFWTVVGVAVASVVPAGLLALFAAGSTGIPFVPSSLLAAAVIALALTAHFTVVMGASSLWDGAHYLEWAIRKNRLAGRVRAGRADASAADRALAREWRRYDHLIREEARLRHEEPQASPFTEVTRERLRRVFGQEVIRVGNQMDQLPQPTRPPALTPAGPGSAAGHGPAAAPSEPVVPETISGNGASPRVSGDVDAPGGADPLLTSRRVRDLEGELSL